MDKKFAIGLFGSGAALGRAIGLSRARISQWPAQLDQRQADLVLGAAVRLGRLPPDYPHSRPSPAAPKKPQQSRRAPHLSDALPSAVTATGDAASGAPATAAPECAPCAAQTGAA